MYIEVVGECILFLKIIAWMKEDNVCEYCNGISVS